MLQSLPLHIKIYLSYTEKGEYAFRAVTNEKKPFQKKQPTKHRRTQKQSRKKKPKQKQKLANSFSPPIMQEQQLKILL